MESLFPTILCIASVPSISGIRWSIRITSYLTSAAIFTDCSPPVAVSTTIPVFLSSPSTTIRFILVSSTMSIRASGALNDSLYVCMLCMLFSNLSWKLPTGSLSVTCWGIVAVKVEPLPYVLFTLMLPPIISRRLRVIASPRPVPSTVLVCTRLTLWNLSNILSISSSLIPMPVSETETISRIIPSSWPLATSSELTLRRTLPSLVYLTAFVRRFVMICLSLTSSPLSPSGSDSSTSTVKSRPLSSALKYIMLLTSLRTELSL